MASEVHCYRCGEQGRLHRHIQPYKDGKPGIDEILLCDDCYEEQTSYLPCCEDFCALSLDHNGLCQK